MAAGEKSYAWINGPSPDYKVPDYDKCPTCNNSGYVRDMKPCPDCSYDDNPHCFCSGE